MTFCQDQRHAQGNEEIQLPARAGDGFGQRRQQFKSTVEKGNGCIVGRVALCLLIGLEQISDRLINSTTFVVMVSQFFIVLVKTAG
ncbi:MAG: hypothetical protein GY759_22705 [Chloroflexi bacterium]|nr:hypothetical protein [Chloroflexota bacterium]